MKKLFAAILSALMICMMMPVTASADYSGPFIYSVNGDEVTITGYTGNEMGELTIPGTIAEKPVTAIGNNAFMGKSFTGVSIPNSVTSIGSHAFDGCSSLASITIPNSVTSIGNNAFDSCTALFNGSITIPASVTTIGSDIFENFPFGATIIINVFKNSYADSRIASYLEEEINSSYLSPVERRHYIGAVITYENTFGCDNSANPISYEYGSGVMSFNALSGRDGYEFVGWTPSSISNGPDGDAVTVTAQWREIPAQNEDTSTPPHISQPSYDPSYNYSYPVPTPIIEIIENIDVTAILNKSGSVDSNKTRLEVLRAARTKGVTKITLILPENCKGISTGAIQKCFKAAGDVKIYLSYDGKTVRLTDKTRQVLTGEYYNNKSA